MEKTGNPFEAMFEGMSFLDDIEHEFGYQDADLILQGHFQKERFDLNRLVCNGDGRREQVFSVLERFKAGDATRAEVVSVLTQISAGIEEDSRRELASKVVPPRYRDFSSKALTKAQSETFQAIRQGRDGIVVGNNGTGKTAIAWSCIERSILDGRRARLVNAFELFENFRQSMKDKGVVDFIQSRYVQYLDLLIIDEVDKSYSSDAERSYLAYLVGQRHDYCRQTVLIGNCKTMEELRDCIGQSVMDRMTGDGGFLVSFGGRSFRQQKEEAR